MVVACQKEFAVLNDGQLCLSSIEEPIPFLTSKEAVDKMCSQDSKKMFVNTFK